MKAFGRNPEQLMSTTMAGSMYTGGENLTLTKVLSEKYKERSFKRTIRHGLLDVVDDIIIAWSKEDGCLLTQVTNPPDSKVQVRKKTARFMFILRSVITNSYSPNQLGWIDLEVWVIFSDMNSRLSRDFHFKLALGLNSGMDLKFSSSG